jgi:hypothetical protein
MVLMAISRILLGRRGDLMIIHLIRPARGTNARSRSRGAVARRYPRIKSGRLPFLCFALHRMGFFVPRELLRER